MQSVIVHKTAVSSQ